VAWSNRVGQRILCRLRVNTLIIPQLTLLILLAGATYYSCKKGIIPHEISIGGAACGFIMSMLCFEWWGAGSRMMGLAICAAGWFVGVGSMWVLLELGKLAFGKKQIKYPHSITWRLRQPDDQRPPVVSLGDEDVPWENIFSRTTDRLIIQCPELRFNGHKYMNVSAILTMELLTVVEAEGQRTQTKWADVQSVGGIATSIQMPREAIGFGVVLGVGMVGAFLGPKPLWGVVLLASVLMFVYSIAERLIRKEAAKPIQVAPFLLISCAILLLLGKA
jgi:leader peptidase (prepilin peptidase) / N-methyltransferase